MLDIIGVVVVGRVVGVVVVALVQGGGILPLAISVGGHRRVGISRGSSYHGKDAESSVGWSSSSSSCCDGAVRHLASCWFRAPSSLRRSPPGALLMQLPRCCGRILNTAEHTGCRYSAAANAMVLTLYPPPCSWPYVRRPVVPRGMCPLLYPRTRT